MSMRSVFLNLNSKDCVDPQYPRWNINDTTLVNIGNAHIGVKFASFPNTVYPINEFNNVFTFFDGTARSVTVPEGAYTGTSLATSLSSLMSASGGGFTYTVTYDSSLSYKLTISCTSTFYVTGGTLAPYIGYTVFDSVLVSSKIADFPLNIAGTSYVDVVTDIGMHTYSSTLGNTTLCRIPVSSNFMTQINWEPAYVLEHVLTVTSLHQIGINLQDDKGLPWILPKNSYFSIVLEIVFVV